LGTQARSSQTIEKQQGNELDSRRNIAQTIKMPSQQETHPYSKRIHQLIVFTNKFLKCGKTPRPAIVAECKKSRRMTTALA